jgi:hypothetical protein
LEGGIVRKMHKIEVRFLFFRVHREIAARIEH